MILLAAAQCRWTEFNWLTNQREVTPNHTSQTDSSCTQITGGLGRLNPLSSLEQPPNSGKFQPLGVAATPRAHWQLMVCLLSNVHHQPYTMHPMCTGFWQLLVIKKIKRLTIYKIRLFKIKNLKGCAPKFYTFDHEKAYFCRLLKGALVVTPPDATARVPRFDRLYGARPPSCFEQFQHWIVHSTLQVYSAYHGVLHWQCRDTATKHHLSSPWQPAGWTRYLDRESCEQSYMVILVSHCSIKRRG